MKIDKIKYNKVPKEERMDKFEYRCTCLWSKDDEYGFISMSGCPVHGKSVNELLKGAKEVK